MRQPTSPCWLNNNATIAPANITLTYEPQKSALKPIDYSEFGSKYVFISSIIYGGDKLQVLAVLSCPLFNPVNQPGK